MFPFLPILRLCCRGVESGNVKKIGDRVRKCKILKLRRLETETGGDDKNRLLSISCSIVVGSCQKMWWHQV